MCIIHIQFIMYTSVLNIKTSIFKLNSYIKIKKIGAIFDTDHINIYLVNIIDYI